MFNYISIDVHYYP